MPEDPFAIASLARAYTAARNSGSATAVSEFFAEDAQIVINGGDPWLKRSGIAEMASGFFADVPDLSLVCDDIRASGQHAIYVWTFTGHDATTKNPLTIHGWEEWELSGDLKIAASRGWFDADDYARQVEGT